VADRGYAKSEEILSARSRSPLVPSMTSNSLAAGRFEAGLYLHCRDDEYAAPRAARDRGRQRSINTGLGMSALVDESAMTGKYRRITR
jgi:hypothetical protein